MRKPSAEVVKYFSDFYLHRDLLTDKVLTKIVGHAKFISSIAGARALVKKCRH